MFLSEKEKAGSLSQQLQAANARCGLAHAAQMD